MPLIGFLSTNDPGRISTICRLEGLSETHKFYRKKIVLLEPGLIQPGQVLYVRIYVRDCLQHDMGGASLPVVLRRRAEGRGWEEVGQAKCCPLCWRILVKPYDDFPDALPQPEFKELSTRQKRALAKGRSVAKEKAEGPTMRRLRDILSSYERFTTNELAEALGITRTATLKHLAKLEAAGELDVEKGRPGRGNPTLYSFHDRRKA